MTRRRVETYDASMPYVLSDDELIELWPAIKHLNGVPLTERVGWITPVTGGYVAAAPALAYVRVRPRGRQKCSKCGWRQRALVAPVIHDACPSCSHPELSEEVP